MSNLIVLGRKEYTSDLDERTKQRLSPFMDCGDKKIIITKR